MEQVKKASVIYKKEKHKVNKLFRTSRPTISSRNATWLKGNNFGTSYSIGGMRPFFPDMHGLIIFFKSMDEKDKEEYVTMCGDEPLLDIRLHIIAVNKTVVGGQTFHKGEPIEELRMQTLHAWEI